MLVLYETALGFCLFKLTDTAKLESADLWEEFESPEKANKLLKLRALHRFTSTATAVQEITAIQEGKVGKGLKKFLSEEIVEKGKGKQSLLVAESKLAHSISKKLKIRVQAVSNPESLGNNDLFRGIREQLTSLLDGLDPKDLATMSLGLSHSLSRYKLKFSPDKVDTMVIQAIALLDDLDKEINIYSMRVKEWYGWHFPELAKIVVDNLAYAKVIKAMGFRTNAAKTDLASILPEDLEATVKAAAEISMGTEISDSDINHIHSLCDQVISITAYRTQLAEYLRNRMTAIAPNLTALVGDLVGARLISHAGSLLSLAKHPASTVQILGAEKALFRALKTKHDTPKYGLIYHASLIGQAPPKLKGKMARMVATKAALSIRVDALTDAEGKSEHTAPSIGLENRAKLEHRLRKLEEELDQSGVRKFNNKPKNQNKYEPQGDLKVYNTAADLAESDSKANEEEDAMDVDEERERTKRKKREEDGERAEKKAKKKAKKEAEATAAAAESTPAETTTRRKRRKSEV
ncbi:Nop domain-containing protein [Thelephora ganbajun]|uniref:Nop domain-containing protein n=1 Tax=Thelephora ganbajun TaxID=370292 RepID=A0ACB6Z675_THEGA|nr:Nop domain-containing protein [Thelephora ganbajun]